MNLDELKTAWMEYDSRLQATEEINHKIIVSMIKERSISRTVRIQRRYGEALALFLLYSIGLLALIVENVFDYTTTIEFIPLVLLNLTCFAMVFFLISARSNLKKVELEGSSLQQALEQMIVVYVKYRQILRAAIVITQIASAMIILSFLPRRIEDSGFLQGILSILIPGVIMLVCIYVMRSRGAKVGDVEKGFRADLVELKELVNS